MSSETIETPLTRLLGVKYPVMLAGMNKVASAELAAAVTNAGGFGSIGGVSYTPRILRKVIADLKKNLKDPNAPFGIDLLLPQVGGNARKTNKDYTGGKLPELIDIVIESGAKLFISAVGVPPKWAVDKLHAAGIPVMNMIGSVRHVKKCLEVGVDLVCAQGSEGGGHTGGTATSVLIPQVVDAVKGHKSAFTGQQVMVVAAGGIYDGRGLAAALSWGAQGVWVGTRFICATEAGSSKLHKEHTLAASSEDTIRTLVYTGRPMRVYKIPYVMDWESNRQAELKTLCAKGVVPYTIDVQKAIDEGVKIDFASINPDLLGQAAGGVQDTVPAKQIVDEMMRDAIAVLKHNVTLVTPVRSRL